MSKKTLNLTVESSIKKKAKHLALQKGISISKLFEQAIESETIEPEFIPNPGSAVERLMNAVHETDKQKSIDYKALKASALNERYEQ